MSSLAHRAAGGTVNCDIAGVLVESIGAFTVVACRTIMRLASEARAPSVTRNNFAAQLSATKEPEAYYLADSRPIPRQGLEPRTY